MCYLSNLEDWVQTNSNYQISWSSTSDPGIMSRPHPGLEPGPSLRHTLGYVQYQKEPQSYMCRCLSSFHIVRTHSTWRVVCWPFLKPKRVHTSSTAGIQEGELHEEDCANPGWVQARAISARNSGVLGWSREWAPDRHIPLALHIPYSMRSKAQGSLNSIGIPLAPFCGQA